MLYCKGIMTKMKPIRLTFTTKILSLFLAPLYLGLSLYAISCTYHCDLLSGNNQTSGHSDHHHGSDPAKEQDHKRPISGDSHLCKMGQKDVSQTITSLHSVITRIDHGTPLAVEKSCKILRTSDRNGILSRAPPVV